LQTIEVLTTTVRDMDYMEARSRVNESGFYHDPGHGWFLREPN
jgi:hypothetical protein